MKIFEAADRADCNTFILWVIKKKNEYGPPEVGEMPARGEHVIVKYKDIEHDVEVGDAQVMGDTEFNWFPEFIIKDYK